MTDSDIRLFNAREAAEILHVRVNVVYELWKRGQLDFWELNGSRTTNLTAINSFLERTKNTKFKIE